jgi:hypothetical protein
VAIGMTGDTGRSPRDTLTDFRRFYYDTALSGSPSALPSLLAFAQPDHILYGSDRPFAPNNAVSYFTAGLDDHLAHTPSGQNISAAIDHSNAAALFPRLARTGAAAPTTSRLSTARSALRDRVVRAAVKLVDPTGQ